MSIASYSDLVTSGANWSHRADSDIAARTAECIALAEAKMNRRLQEKAMVTKDAAFSISSEYVAVPTSFGGVKTFYLNTTPRQNLEFLPDHLMTFKYQDGQTGQPVNFNVQGSNFRFGPIPGSTYTATLVYYLQVPALTGAAPTNWMILSHPDAYVYGVQAELAGWAKDYPAQDVWLNRMYAVIDEIKKASKRDSYGGDGAIAAVPG